MLQLRIANDDFTAQDNKILEEELGSPYEDKDLEGFKRDPIDEERLAGGPAGYKLSVIMANAISELLLGRTMNLPEEKSLARLSGLLQKPFANTFDWYLNQGLGFQFLGEREVYMAILVYVSMLRLRIGQPPAD
jgi:hypothetical protein